MNTRPRQRGSILLMTVGLLTILAMLGGTLLIIANLDRKANHALAGAAPITQEAVAKDTLVKLQGEAARTLHIGANGTYPYDPNTTIPQTITYPDDSSDRALASTSPYWDASSNRWRWRHVSYLQGNPYPPAPNLATTDTRLADTDGDNVPDSLLYDSLFRDSQNGAYYVAVRMIDASALINVNTAYKTIVADPNRPMPVTNVDPNYLGLNPTTINDERTRLSGVWPPDRIPADLTNGYIARYVICPLNPVPRIAGRPFPSFDPGDMTAIRWLNNDPNKPPYTAAGRLCTAMGGPLSVPFLNYRSYFTTWSSARIILPRPVTSGTTTQWWKTDLNDTRGNANQQFTRLFNTFWNLIPLNVPALSDGADPNATKETTCAQLAANVMDFRDADDDVTAVKKDANGLSIAAATDSTGIIAYGIERQPFLTEVFYKQVLDPNDPNVPPAVHTFSAIKLYNPYSSAVKLDGYELRNGAVIPPTGGWAGKTIGPNARLVIVSDINAIPVASPPAGATVIACPGLDLGQNGITIARSRMANNTGLKDVVIATFAKVSVTTAPLPGVPFLFCQQWDDRPQMARYTLPDALIPLIPPPDYTNANGWGLATAATTKLGMVNPPGNFSGLNQAPCPVYVRNGRFINTAELDRIFYVGPSNGAGKDQDLRAALTNSGNISNGRLPMDLVSTGVTPQVPLGVLAGDYFMVESPLADGLDNDADGRIDPTDPNLVGREDSVYGRIDINTAPDQVLASLPGIAATGADSLKLVREIIAYRDLLDNSGLYDANTGSGGGTNYDPNVKSRATATGIANLRGEPGFACPGEIAIPLWLRGSKSDINALYRLPPGAGAQSNYGAGNVSPYNYALAGAQSDDDGLKADAANKVLNDFTKYHTFYSWLSNQVTVRSDVFIAYIRVQLGKDPAAATGVQRYLAVIDRSNCRTANDVPTVLMFMQIK